MAAAAASTEAAPGVASADAPAVTVAPTGRPQPAIFLSHGGGPCFFFSARDVPMFKDMDKASPTADFLRSLPEALPRTPSGIVVVSAHWEGPDEGSGMRPAEASRARVGVLSRPSHELLFDYYGFPRESYSIRWPARGDDALAGRVEALLSGAGFATAHDSKRGLDHGVFVPLSVAWPDGAPAPLVQVSLHPSLDAAAHVRLGRALAALRSSNILVIGSGALTHNLGAMRGGPPPPGKNFAWADSFIADVTNALTGKDPLGALESWTTLRGARTAHPREEHLLPLMVAAGAAAGSEPGGGAVKARRVHKAMASGSFALDAWRFEEA